MKVDYVNIDTIEYFCGGSFNIKHDRELLRSLLKDLEELNSNIDDVFQHKKIYIEYIDKHTEYSSERTDPCPDFYGCFSLRFENYQCNTIGDPMIINELDNALFILNDFLQKI